MVKIIDVAEKAGVAPSTVSHVLNGKRPISKATRERVLRVIKEMGYVPNPNAQALKSNRTGIVGFIAHDITESFVPQILRGVEKVICNHDSYLAIVSGVEFDYDINKAIEFLNKRRLDGIIISYEITLKDPLKGLPPLNVPVVTINRTADENHFSVLPDNIDGGYRAAVHLLEAGVKKPAMISASRERFASEERKRGFIRGLKDRGITIPESRIYYGDFSYEAGIKGLRNLLKKNPHIDGIFCANDYIAAGALHEALKEGIHVPRMLKIIGYDNRDFSSFGPVPITTFAQPLEYMGELSGQILIDLINGQSSEANKKYLKSTLLKRTSTALS